MQEAKLHREWTLFNGAVLFE
ncbi:hypothetical protein TcasGA2_TC012987 [Tribolium castaneum]|uniref:Uncharacterized protein n=1 Tax=Tribolium castaneum TaxID=7070 RepID=D7GY16_TRICA|nr:hypothetical protein TcasGA2_TC012987 [Tribolium castaneum]